MQKLFRPGRACWVALIFTIAPGLSRAQVQTRVYAVWVDGKPAGDCAVTYSPGEGGSETVSGKASVAVRKLLGVYRYHYEGIEVWKDGRLQKFTSTSDDDGKKSSVQADAGPTGLRVVANGTVTQVKSEAWPTSYWRLLASELHQQPLTLLDADTGQAQIGKLTSAGRFRVKVGDREVICTLFKITGQVQASLYYDDQGRLVRQSYVDSGHQTLIEMKR